MESGHRLDMIYVYLGLHTQADIPSNEPVLNPRVVKREVREIIRVIVILLLTGFFLENRSLIFLEMIF